METKNPVLLIRDFANNIFQFSSRVLEPSLMHRQRRERAVAQHLRVNYFRRQNRRIARVQFAAHAAFHVTERLFQNRTLR